jgi:hypothetical protein
VGSFLFPLPSVVALVLDSGGGVGSLGLGLGSALGFPQFGEGGMVEGPSQVGGDTEQE